MESVNWQQFGIKKNPFDTAPLLEGGELPIEEAFVGRGKECQMLNKIMASQNRSCVVVGGDVGVGKTSLVNFHKFRWKTLEGEKSLFSFRREIEAGKNMLDKKGFLLEIISSILRELELVEPSLVDGDDFLKGIKKVVDITQDMSLSGQAMGFGLGAGEATVMPLELPMVTVERCFDQLLEYVMSVKIKGRTYKGFIVHVNNFEVVLGDKKSARRVRRFFDEVRDVLQKPYVHYVFLGPRDFYRNVISQQPRVRSIFYMMPLLLEPLRSSDVVKAINKRMELLKSPDVSRIMRPFDDQVIHRLYEIYVGDIRHVMDALSNILVHYGDRVVDMLKVDQALALLATERWNNIEQQLTPEQQMVLRSIVESEDPISQKETAEHLNKQPSNISYYYFKKLKELGVIEVKKEEKRMKYWGLTMEYTPLKYWQKSQQRENERVASELRQLSLLG